MKFEPVATGYCFLEAPRADGDVVWFGELLLGGLHRLSPGGKIDAFLPGRIHIGGVAINEDGTVICGGEGGLAWLNPVSGASGVLLDAIDGEPIRAANDMYPDGKGGLYFGTSIMGAPAEGENPNKIYRLDPDGSVTLLIEGLKIANGIGLSPDGTRLYHSESLVGAFVYDVLPDGGLGQKTPFSAREDCDGLAVDAQGGVWIAYFASGEVVRYLPDGSVAARFPLPHKAVSSLCFGGPDWREVYVTTGGDDGVDALLEGRLPPCQAGVFHARSEVPGLPVPRTRLRLPAQAARA